MMTHALSLALGILLVGLTVFVALVCWGMHEAIIERKERRAAQKRAFEERPRGKILKIGSLIRDSTGKEYPYAFQIDCLGIVPQCANAPDGEMLIAGWRQSELIEMAKRREEFEL